MRTLTATSETIAAVWTALLAQEGPPSSATRSCRHQTAEIMRGAAAAGWTGILEAETLLLAAGIGIPTANVRETLALFGVAPQCTYRRPRSRTTVTLGAERVAAIDLAHLLILVERSGFPIDPAPLCEALRPSLQAKAYLTGAELAVYWFGRERHRSDPLTIAVDSGAFHSRAAETCATSAGYRAELFRDADGEPTALTVTAPKWRQSRRSLAA